jgi:hypothetical protein
VTGLEIENKPGKIFNCDETGWSIKEKGRQKVFGFKCEHAYQQSLFVSGHITGHLCICVNGTILSSIIIFENLFRIQHIGMVFLVSGCIGSRCLTTLYMNSDLFFKWFRDTFIPHCGSAHPVLLVLHNHESHISIEVIHLARANRIELLGIPAHTTHILQPLDV